MLNKKCFLIVAVSLFFVGCSTYSKKECESFTWDNEGYATALKGKPIADGVSHYQKKCHEEHQVVPDQSKFNEGYKRGLAKFCSAKSAYAYGLDGKEYKGICPNEKEFLSQYNVGSNQYLKARVRELETEVSHLEAERNTLRAYVDELLGVNSSLKQQQQLNGI